MINEAKETKMTKPSNKQGGGNKNDLVQKVIKREVTKMTPNNI